MKRAVILSFLFLAVGAFASDLRRLYPSSRFAGGSLAVGLYVNNEFQNIVDWLNLGNIASQNIGRLAITTNNLSTVYTDQLATWGAVGPANVATGSSAYIKDFRQGCSLRWVGGDQVAIDGPCQIIVDGMSGAFSADDLDFGVTIGIPEDMDTGAPPSDPTVVYVYGKVLPDGFLDFKMSVATPNIVTMRKPTDSTQRYIGSLHISSAGDIDNFTMNGNRYFATRSQLVGTLYNPIDTEALTTSPTTPRYFDIPPFSQFAIIAIDKSKTFADTYVPYYYSPGTGMGNCNVLFGTRPMIFNAGMGTFSVDPLDIMVKNVFVKERATPNYDEAIPGQPGDIVGGRIVTAPYLQEVPVLSNSTGSAVTYVHDTDCDLDEPSNLTNASSGGNMFVWGWVEPEFLY